MGCASARSASIAVNDALPIVSASYTGFASSKTCFACGDKIASLPLSVREWQCPACGVRHDRDVNAAINLAHYAVSYTVSACEGEGAGFRRKPKVKPTPKKQEFNTMSTFSEL